MEASTQITVPYLLQWSSPRYGALFAEWVARKPEKRTEELSQAVTLLEQKGVEFVEDFCDTHTIEVLSSWGLKAGTLAQYFFLAFVEPLLVGAVVDTCGRGVDTVWHGVGTVWYGHGLGVPHAVPVWSFLRSTLSTFCLECKCVSCRPRHNV